MSRLYSTKEAAEASGVAVETVRYDCKIDLVPRVMRDENNYRVFDDHDIAWLKGLHCLRECGMGIEQMRHYMELCLQGEESIPEREAMLIAQRQVVEDKIALLKEMLGFIDSKMEFYAGVRSGEIEYQSNLLTPVSSETALLAFFRTLTAGRQDDSQPTRISGAKKRPHILLKGRTFFCQ